MHKHALKIIFCFLSIIPFMAVAQSNIVDSIIKQTKEQYAPDSRTAIFSISGELLNDSICVLKGSCDSEQAVEALLQSLDNAQVTYINGIKMLPDKQLGNQTRAIVTVCCAHLRGTPGHPSEMVSQAILGTPLRLLEKQGNWYRVQTPDNYISWIIANSITVQDGQEWNDWKNSTRYIYTGHQGYVYQTAERDAEIVSDIVAGSILQADGKAKKGFVPVSFPDGRKGFLRSDECQELSEWASQPLNMDIIIDTAKKMMGSTYLWGGTSVKSADCSGFVKTAYFCSGIILTRDASQQAFTGEIIPTERWKECQTGDLLFFGNANGKVDHVALYLNNGQYIHSSGQVKVNSLDPEADDYLPNIFLSISRIKNKIGTPGITPVKDHPWYFNQK